MLHCFLRILSQETKNSFLLDAIAFNTPPSGDLESFAASLTGITSNSFEKARMIFAWITYYIHYRQKGKEEKEDPISPSNSKKYSQDVFNSRISTNSEGHSYLFHEMASSLNLKTKIVEGTLKTLKGSKYHTRNAIEYEGTWYFLDCLMGSGYFNISKPNEIAKVIHFLKKNSNPYFLFFGFLA